MSQTKVEAKQQLLRLRCPRCKTLSVYGGYPSEPILSTVLCLMCGYAGPGARFEHVHPTGQRCGKV